MRARFVPLVLALWLPSGARAATWWEELPFLGAEDVLVLAPEGAHRDTIAIAKREGFVVVDLSDQWAPFIFSETDDPATAPKPNPYRATFLALANDGATPDQVFLDSPVGRAAVLSTVPAELRSAVPGDLSPAEKLALDRAERTLRAERSPNFLEVYGIPPTLSVLAKRVAEDAGKECYAAIDGEGLARLDSEITYQNRDQARRDFAEAGEDANWVADRLATLGLAEAPAPEQAIARILELDPAADTARLERYRRGQTRLRAVRAAQARLECEGLLRPETHYVPGAFDFYTHRALADFEKKNDIFGWGFLGGETQHALARPPLELHFESFRRVLAERVADAAGIVEDGSVARTGSAATFTDADGATQPIPDLIGEFVDRSLQALGIQTPEDMLQFLAAVGTQGPTNLSVAFSPPRLPAYYERIMDLSAEIDRGDVWYDVPFDAEGKPVVQRRRNYPRFTLYVNWRGQKIPLVRWRTTIGSWRSELHPDGRVYLKYKNSNVGPAIWRNVIAAPVWIPPASTPGKDLLTLKTFDPRHGPVRVVNTDVIGPGFASAYGLVMAIHLQKLPEGGVFDDQIRTHGSVDYTSIARRFSHGCHRLVNNRAVRLFDFVLRHRKYRRAGSARLPDFKRRFWHEGRKYEFELASRGYYYELRPPVPVEVLEGNILGRARKPIAAYVRKPGVDYGPAAVDNPIEPPTLGP